MHFDWRDGIVLGGMLLLGVGLWLRAPWLALTVVGALLMLFGVLAQLGTPRR